MGTNIFLFGILSLASLTSGMFAPGNFGMNNSGGIYITAYSPSTPAPKKIFIPRNLYLDIDMLTNLSEESSEHGSSLLKNFSEKYRHIPNIFYSTDELLTNIEDLSPVADSLERNEVKGSRLFLSFRVVKDGKISLDRFADALRSLNTKIPEEKLKSLKNHVSGIILDLEGSCSQSYHRDLEEYKRGSPDYGTKWDISLVKYAKKFARRVLGVSKSDTDFKVGVMLNDSQYDCWDIKQQLKGADVYVINTYFEVDHLFPLSYEKFRFHMNRDSYRLEQRLPTSLKNNGTKVMFKVNLFPRQYSDYSWADEKLQAYRASGYKFLNESEIGSLILLAKFGKRWTEEGRSDLIISTNIDLYNRNENISKRIPGSYGLLPYLHVQEVDVTACQLKSMLSHSTEKFHSLVVSEYTWSAFANYEKEMDSDCPKAPQLAHNSPSLHLLFSSGFRMLWNATESYFTELLTNHQTIAGWNLSTIIFPSEDIASLGEGYIFNDDFNEIPSVNSSIVEFAKEMANDYEIGCLVSFDEDIVHYFTTSKNMPNNMIRTTVRKCNPIWNETSLIVWQLNISNFENRLDFDFSFAILRDSGLRRTLLEVLLGMEKIAERYPDKELILQFNVGNVDKQIENINKVSTFISDDECSEGITNLHEFYKAIMGWANVHAVKVIFPPAYQTQNPVRGLWQIPSEDGTPNKVNFNKCTDPRNSLYEMTG